MKKSGKRPASWKRTLLTVLCVILAMILAALILVTAYVEMLLGGINRFDDNGVTLSQEEIDSILNDNNAAGTGPSMNDEDVNFGSGPSEIIGGEDMINILLIGQDKREGQGRQRSDAMILCTVNTNTGTLTMTSFLRDMYVEIPGYRNNKINACYQIGGMELLDACLEKNFGIRVDANIEIDFDGFMELIDMVGGVDVELTSAEASYLNRHGNWDVEANQHWSLKAGVNTLTGSQALAYSRIRAIGMDFERTERQRRVLTALVEKAKDLNLLEINSLITKAVTLVTTDMTNKEIFNYAAELFPLLSDLKLHTQRIPADGTYSFADLPGAGDSIVLDFDANRKLLVETLTD